MSKTISAHTPINGAPGYAVTNDGRVFSIGMNWRGYGEREIKPVDNADGYLKVRLMIGGRRRNLAVHRIVAMTFVGPRPSPAHEACHIDGDRRNNVASNLRWGTRRENAADRDRHGRTSRGPSHAAAIRAGRENRHV